jgi:hypothetical protein
MIPRLRGAAAIAAVAVLAGCGAGGAGVSAVPDPVGPHPVVLTTQARTVLTKVAAGASSAVSAGTATGIGPRVIGPEKGMLAASLKLPVALRPQGPATEPSWQRLLVPAQTGWPRWFAGVGTSSSRTTPVIWVLASADARTPYGLWGELVMLPGAQLPEVAPVDRGAPELAPDATGLVAGPKDVAAWYADVLGAGTGSRYAKSFATDVFRDQVLKKVAADRVKLQTVQGTLTSQHVVQGSPLALRTADGGALVIVAFTETYTVKLPANAGTVNFGDPVVTALAGKSSFSSQVVQTSTELVAFTVPPASAGGQIEVVAAAKAHLSATGS